jgi:hypothetical protein
MNLFWIIVLPCTSAIVGTSFCFYLLRKADKIEPVQWPIEHIACPITHVNKGRMPGVIRSGTNYNPQPCQNPEINY